MLSTAEIRPTAPAVPRPVRDPFVDVVRVAAIMVIVALHWLMPVLSYDAGVLTTDNALAGPGGWAVTWIAQTMPLVFFAGGAAAGFSLGVRPPSAAGSWLRTRLRRLALPVVPLIAVWLPLPHLLLVLGAPAEPVETASRLAARLLWFVALYVLVTLLTPALLRLHRRFGGAEVVAMAIGAVGVDAVRFGLLGGAEAAGYANVVLVWGAVYQVGITYAHGRLRHLHGRRAGALAAVGLATTAAAVVLGPYAASMIGIPGAELSNMNPPTAVLLGVAAMQLCLLLALRPVIVAWASTQPVAAGIAWLSRRLMTVYVWHTPALLAVAVLAVGVFGWSTPEPLSAAWRQEMPVWLAALALVLAGLVRLFGRYEDGARRAPAPGAWRAGAAAALLGPGLLALTVNGFAPAMATHPAGPAAAGTAVVAGAALLRPRHRPHERLTP